MELKIGRYLFNVKNTDWILDNRACYQCVTLKHRACYNTRYSLYRDEPTIMSKQLFKKLVAENKIIKVAENIEKEIIEKRHYSTNCKIWRFNINE